MEAGASGATGQNAASLVDLECSHVNGSATHPNLRMVAGRVMRKKKYTKNSAGKGNAEVNGIEKTGLKTKQLRFNAECCPSVACCN